MVIGPLRTGRSQAVQNGGFRLLKIRKLKDGLRRSFTFHLALCHLSLIHIFSGRPDDTAAALATWSFLHGYAVLEHSGAFGASGPKGALERGLTAFLMNFRLSPPASPKKCAGTAAAVTKRHKRRSNNQPR